VFFDQGFKINIHRFTDNGSVDFGDIVRIGCLKIPDPNIFHVIDPFVSAA
jgi:hypothetical protein